MLCLRIVPEWKKNIIFSTNPPGAFSFIDHLAPSPACSSAQFPSSSSSLFVPSTGDSAGDRSRPSHRCENGAFVSAALRGETEATKRRIAMNQNIHIILRLKIRINTWMEDRIFLHTRWDPVGGASNHFILSRVSKMCTYSVSATSVVQANRHDLFTKKLHAYPN